ncbi:MAG: hypothetical protein FWC57_02420, partial [Endomicrobia bacterium]|nr:hypothetical protein [Endomicrobiia bacterium]
GDVIGVYDYTVKILGLKEIDTIKEVERYYLLKGLEERYFRAFSNEIFQHFGIVRDDVRQAVLSLTHETGMDSSGDGIINLLKIAPRNDKGIITDKFSYKEIRRVFSFGRFRRVDGTIIERDAGIIGKIGRLNIDLSDYLISKADDWGYKFDENQKKFLLRVFERLFYYDGFAIDPDGSEFINVLKILEEEAALKQIMDLIEANAGLLIKDVIMPYFDGSKKYFDIFKAIGMSDFTRTQMAEALFNYLMWKHNKTPGGLKLNFNLAHIKKIADGDYREIKKNTDKQDIDQLYNLAEFTQRVMPLERYRLTKNMLENSGAAWLVDYWVRALSLYEKEISKENNSKEEESAKQPAENMYIDLGNNSRVNFYVMSAMPQDLQNDQLQNMDFKVDGEDVWAYAHDGNVAIYSKAGASKVRDEFASMLSANGKIAPSKSLQNKLEELFASAGNKIDLKNMTLQFAANVDIRHRGFDTDNIPPAPININAALEMQKSLADIKSVSSMLQAS